MTATLMAWSLPLMRPSGTPTKWSIAVFERPRPPARSIDSSQSLSDTDSGHPRHRDDEIIAA